MMAGNPNLWRNIIHPSVFPSQYVVGSSSTLPLNSFGDQIQEFPQSLSQLLLQGGCWDGDEERYMGASSHFQSKSLEIYEDQILNPSVRRVPVVDVKQEEPVSQNSNLCGHGDEEFQEVPATVWSQMMPASSPRSCVTSLLEFSHNKADCNSTASGGACKKARVHPTCSQPPLKVRKEKLGDRITALHQLVSPFGKTDTASVLFEAIGYIRFLQSQIEALSSPYLTNASGNTTNLQQSGTQEKAKDLRSRGLCLVPMSCTMQVGSDNGADYWAPVPY